MHEVPNRESDKYVSFLYPLSSLSCSSVPSLIPTDTGCGYRQPKARLGRKHVRPWKWMTFTNPARQVRRDTSLYKLKLLMSHFFSSTIRMVSSCVTGVVPLRRTRNTRMLSSTRNWISPPTQRMSTRYTVCVLYH